MKESFVSLFSNYISDPSQVEVHEQSPVCRRRKKCFGHRLAFVRVNPDLTTLFGLSLSLSRLSGHLERHLAGVGPTGGVVVVVVEGIEAVVVSILYS